MIQREIKFRAKDTKGNWVYGYYFATGRSYFIRNDEGDVWAINPDTLGQFTGLTDKNGKEIWEGDVIAPYSPNEDELWTCDKSVVEYLEKDACFALPVLDDGDLFEILGNRYDNPELLEG